MIQRRLDVIGGLKGEHGQPLVLLPWWKTAFEKLDDPDTREILLSIIRQSGKSQLLAALAISELLCVPNSYTVLVAASESQQQAIYNRKIRKPFEKLLSSLGLKGQAKFTAHGIEMPACGSA